jgi:acyl carrier protein
MSQDISDPIEAMTFETARGFVLKALHGACGLLNDPLFARRLDDPNSDIDFSELELDSLGMVQATLALEDETGIEVDVGELVNHATVNSLSELVVAKAGGQ